MRGTNPIHCLVVAVLIALGVRAAGAQEQQLTAAYNASGQDLFWHFSTTTRGNIVFSPYSIGTAMAMALSGARGETETQMAAALKHGLLRADMESANANVLATLNGYDKSAPFCAAGTVMDGQICKGPRLAGGGCAFPSRLVGNDCVDAVRIPPSARLSVANALMLMKSGDAVAPDYVALLKDKFAAEVFSNVKLEQVNEWVGRKTESKISKILDELDPGATAVLLNAVYFRATWDAPFDKRETVEEAFSLTVSERANVPTMHKVGRYVVTSQPGFKAIRLPYAVNALGMVIVLPDRIDGLREVSAQLDAAELSKLMAALQSGATRDVDLALPRFKANFSADLVPPFRHVGMTLAFDSEKANFSGMSMPGATQGRFFISTIAHRAVIDVEEEGAEAAAATAVGMVTASIGSAPPPEPFKVDRPFLFYLVDKSTAAILFQGRIMDPRQ